MNIDKAIKYIETRNTAMFVTFDDMKLILKALKEQDTGPCIDCDGSGVIPKLFSTKTCPSCGGSGRQK